VHDYVASKGDALDKKRLDLLQKTIAVPPVFDHIMVMTGGGPALQTDVLMTYIVRTAVQKGLFGRGAAASYLLLPMVRRPVGAYR